MMYILTKEQIKKVEDYLEDFIEINYDETQELTEDELDIFYKERFGDGPFIFEGIRIVNPILSISGRWLGGYKKACEYYGEEDVNNFFGETLKAHFKENPEEDKDAIIEELKASNDPIYKDDNYIIYHFKDRDEIDEKSNIEDYKDMDILEGDNEEYYLVSGRDTNDDDFVGENNSLFAITYPSMYVYGDYDSKIDNLDELKYFLEKDDKNCWDFINENILKIFIYKQCGLINAETFSLNLPLKRLENAFDKLHLKNSTSSELVKEVLFGDYIPDVTYLYEYDLPSYVINDINEKNLKSLNLSKEDLEKLSRIDLDSERLENIYKLIFSAYRESIQNISYSNLLNAILEEIKACFPKYFQPYIEIDQANFSINNCPKNVISKLIDDYIYNNETDAYLDSLYRSLFYWILEDFIKRSFDIRLEDTYDDYDRDEFNECLEIAIDGE